MNEVLQMDYKTYLATIAAESKDAIKELRSSSQRVFDPDKERCGSIERYDPVEHEVCDVEIVGTDFVVTNVPLLKLKPHSAFRFRAGHRIQVNDWIGIVNKVERKVVVKCTNGTKRKFYVDEESTGDVDSSKQSNEKLPLSLEKSTPESPDPFSTIYGIPYPGNRISLTDDMERSSRDSSCLWDMKNLYIQLGGIFRARELGEADIVKKVKIKNLEVEWETKKVDVSLDTPSSKVVISSAEVLAPLNQEYCEEGSCRIYELTDEDIIMPKTMWMNEKVRVEGAPRNLTFDEVDKSGGGKEWLQRNGHLRRFVENGVVVKIITKKRFVGIRWEDGSLEFFAVPEVKNLKIYTPDYGEDEDLYEISLDVDSESVKKMPLNAALSSSLKGLTSNASSDSVDTIEQQLGRLVFDESNLSSKQDVDAEAEGSSSVEQGVLNLSSTRL